MDEAAWHEVRSRLERRHTELLETLAHFDPDRLDDVVDPRHRKDSSRPVSFRDLLHGVAQHNAYHAGQITLLRKVLETGE